MGWVIERSLSEWAFLIVLVKDGFLRKCVDYRRLNAIANADTYPMPRVDDMIDALGRVKYVTTLDLSCVYWQVPVEEELCCLHYALRTIPVPCDAIRSPRSASHIYCIVVASISFLNLFGLYFGL